MTKRALFAVAGFLGLCLSLSAQQTQRPEPFQFDGSTLDRSSSRLPSLTLADQDRFFFSTAFGSILPPAEFLPAFDPVEPLSMAYTAPVSRRDSVDDVGDLRSPDRIRVGGEMGVFYGKSSGKYGREDFQTYIFGTIGTDKFSITAGVLHQESSGRIPTRFSR